jgi:hypothetical protein
MTRPKDIDWSQVEDLGKIPDRIIAERFGCHKSVIGRIRYRLGIPGCPPSSREHRKSRINWDEIKDLGKISNCKIARRLGCSETLVRLACKARNIIFKPRRIDWKAVTDLGKIWDLTIAKRLNIHQATVSHARTRLGIPPYKRVITCICCGNLYEASKEKTVTCSRKCHNVARNIARGLDLDSIDGLSPSIVMAFERTIDYQNQYVKYSSHRGIDWDNIATLGVLTDREVARQLNCAFNTVASARNRRGIPCALRRKKEKGNGKSARN